MDSFEIIDKYLEEFAKEVGGRLIRDRGGDTLKLFGFQERRIDWIREGINLAVIIQPNIFREIKFPNEWEVSLVAWKDLDVKRYSCLKIIKEKQSLNEIELEIKGYLQEGKEFLNSLEFKDLVPSMY